MYHKLFYTGPMAPAKWITLFFSYSKVRHISDIVVVGASIDQSVFIGKVNKNFCPLLSPKQIQIQIKL